MPYKKIPVFRIHGTQGFFLPLGENRHGLCRRDMVVRAIKTARKLREGRFLAVLGKGAGSPKRMNQLTWLGVKLLFGDVQLVMPLSGKVRRHFFLCGFHKCGIKISCVGRADRNTPHAGDAFAAICSGEVRCGDSSCGADAGTDSALDTVLISFGMDLDAAHFGRFPGTETQSASFPASYNAWIFPAYWCRSAVSWASGRFWA